MSKYPIIAREGWSPIILMCLLSASLIYSLGFAASIPGWLSIVALLYLFRDPPRITPSKPLAVIAPVQGTVVAADSQIDPWLDRTALSLRVKMSPLDIFALHSPIEGKVIKQWQVKPDKKRTHDGQMFQSAHWIRTDEGDDVVLVICTRHLRSRLRCSLRAGERIGQGQRCGVVYFGAEVEVLLADNTRKQSKIGDKVIAGSSILGELVHPAEVSMTQAAVNGPGPI